MKFGANSTSSSAVIVVAFSVCFHTIQCFTIPSLSLPLKTLASSKPCKKSCTLMKSSNDMETLSWLEVQRQECQKALEQLEIVKKTIDTTNTTEELETITRNDLNNIEEHIIHLTSKLLPPAGLSSEQYSSMVSVVSKLPPNIRVAIVDAVGMESEAAGDIYQVEEIVKKIYQERYELTPQVLLKAMKKAKSVTYVSSGEQYYIPTISSSSTTKSKDEDRGPLDFVFELETIVDIYLPKVTRKEGIAVTPKDLQTLYTAFDKSTFVPRGDATSINGGYIIRGTCKTTSGQELIDKLDAKLPNNWNGTVCYLPDFTDVDNPTGDENILVLLHRDFSPAFGQWLFNLFTVASLATALFFSAAVYSGNDFVLNKLNEVSSTGEFVGVGWFTGKVLDIFLPIAIILASHNLGHRIVADRDDLECATALPTLLPAYLTLPVTCTLTRLKSPPKSLTSLFDFAFMGPLLGFISSSIYFGIGLEATKAIQASGTAAQELPSLPINLLKMSTLGSAVIDNYFGGDGVILNQVSATVPLHPFAIAGFCGLIINAIELLPLGATDGARIGLALFGRRKQSFVGQLTWVVMLASLLIFFDDGSSGALVNSWVLFNFVQNDMEVPAREEVDNVNLPRVLAAISMWFFAALVLTPV